MVLAQEKGHQVTYVKRERNLDDDKCERQTGTGIVPATGAGMDMQMRMRGGSLVGCPHHFWALMFCDSQFRPGEDECQGNRCCRKRGHKLRTFKQTVAVERVRGMAVPAPVLHSHETELLRHFCRRHGWGNRRDDSQ